MADGDITQNLLDELGLRLEDADEVKFTQEAKLEALNKAQLRLSQLLHDGYLTELEKVDSDVDVTSEGIINLDSINTNGNGILRGGEGIIRVQVDIGGHGGASLKWATEIELRDIKKTQNTFLAGSNTNPLYYVFQKQIKIIITTYIGTKANVYYLQIPPTMATNVDPIINPSLRHLMLDLAESDCWKMDNKHDRATVARNSAFEEIKVLNERYTIPEGIGTNNRK